MKRISFLGVSSRRSCKSSSVQFSCLVVSGSLQSHELQPARPPCPSPTPRVCSNSCQKKKDVLFIVGDWNAKVRSQEIPRIIGKFGLGVQNEAGQRLTELCQENTLVIANTLFQQHKRWLTHGHHQMVNTKIRLIIFFAAKDGKALYSQ